MAALQRTQGLGSTPPGILPGKIIQDLAGKILFKIHFAPGDAQALGQGLEMLPRRAPGRQAQMHPHHFETPVPEQGRGHRAVHAAA